MSKDAQHEIDNWIKQLSENDMPVFSGTVTDVTSAVNSDKSSAVDVAQAILRDAALTGRLLKMANSVYFNPSRTQINTVSRAVMVLGFDQVRAMTLSLTLVDNLTNGSHRSKLVEEMAHAFHAATQAQDLAKMVNAKGAEDIFIATLLSNIGNMAFWAFSEELGEKLLSQLDDDEDPAAAESKVLGFHLNDLTKGLSKSWSLGELLDDFLNDRILDKRISFIRYGKKLATATKNGWQSDEAQQAIEDIADELDIDVEDLEQAVFKNARKAIELTTLYGSHEASQKIPRPSYSMSEQSELAESSEVVDDYEETLDELLVTDKEEPKQPEVTTGFPEPNPAVQMTIMQEISSAMQEKPSIGIILEMVLEGLHRGVGMDRALFVILNPKRTHLQCKYAIGDNTEHLYEDLVIDVRRPENIFHKIIESQQPMIIPGDPKKLTGTLSKATLTALGKPPYLVMPCIVKNKVIGIFMADRKASERQLTEQDFFAFQQFCMQANMGLSFLATRG